jgi:tetratricopeptide (TPR) repeat protein
VEQKMRQAGLDPTASEAWERHAAALEFCRSYQFVVAEAPARHAWAIVQARPEVTSEVTADFAENLAKVLDALGAVMEAEGLHRQAEKAAEDLLAVKKTVLPLMAALGGLAANLRIQHRFDEAERCLQRALALGEVYGEVGPLESIGLLCDLGTVYCEAGRLAESEATFRRARTAIETELGQNHPEAATLYHQLALLEQKRGRHEAGEAYARQALEIRMAAAGSEYQVVGDGAALGSLLAARGRYEEAEPLLRHALDTFEAAAGPDSFDVARVAERLGGLLASAGRPEEAIALYRRALAIKERMFGAGHPALTTTMHNLAVVCEGNGHADEARALWARAMTLLGTDDRVAEPRR